ETDESTAQVSTPEPSMSVDTAQSGSGEADPSAATSDASSADSPAQSERSEGESKEAPEPPEGPELSTPLSVIAGALDVRASVIEDVGKAAGDSEEGLPALTGQAGGLLGAGAGALELWNGISELAKAKSAGDAVLPLGETVAGGLSTVGGIASMAGAEG